MPFLVEARYVYAQSAFPMLGGRLCLCLLSASPPHNIVRSLDLCYVYLPPALIPLLCTFPLELRLVNLPALCVCSLYSRLSGVAWNLVQSFCYAGVFHGLKSKRLVVWLYIWEGQSHRMLSTSTLIYLYCENATVNVPTSKCWLHNTQYQQTLWRASVG